MASNTKAALWEQMLSSTEPWKQNAHMPQSYTMCFKSRIKHVMREVAENVHLHEVTFSLGAYLRPGHTTVYPHTCVSSQEAGNILLAFWPRITRALM